MAEKFDPGAEAVMYRSSAPVRVRAYTSKERDHLLSILHSRVDGSVFEGYDAPVPFFFRVEASNQNIDSYFTRMAKSSLKNYAQDATDPGVQFQVSHNGSGGMFGGSGEVGFGRSLEGKFIARAENPATAIDFYTIPGLVCGNMSSDQFIMGARSGIYQDVSVGFTPGAFICNICGGDMMARWDAGEDMCLHYPGITYDVAKGSRTERVLCIADVEDGHLNEVSTVYDGATPGAGILAIDMARMAAAHGRLNPLDHQLIENTYRVKIDLPERIYGGLDMTGRAKAADAVVENVDTTDSQTLDAAARTVADAEVQNPSETQGEEEETRVVFSTDETEDVAAETETRALEPMERLRRKYEGTVVRLTSQDPYRAIEVLADACVQADETIKGLRKDAADGRAYRESLLTRLDESVVRAFGAEAAAEKQERYRRLAGHEDAAGVEALIADLEIRAGERFKGGRATRDDVTEGADEIDTPADETRKRGRTPAHLVL
jgi:hypothetical protein